MIGGNLKIKGNGVSRFSNLLKQKLDNIKEIRTSDTTIILKEKFYLRISANLFSVIVVIKGKNLIKIEIRCGGGTFDLFKTGDSALRKELKTLLNKIEEIANENKWFIIDKNIDYNKSL